MANVINYRTPGGSNFFVGRLDQTDPEHRERWAEPIAVIRREAWARSGWLRHYAGLYSLSADRLAAELHTPENVKERLAKAKKSAVYLLAVAYEDDPADSRVVGAAGMTPDRVSGNKLERAVKQLQDDGRVYAETNYVDVRPEDQGVGYGLGLFATALALAPPHRPSTLYSSVNDLTLNIRLREYYYTTGIAQNTYFEGAPPVTEYRFEAVSAPSVLEHIKRVKGHEWLSDASEMTTQELLQNS